MNKSTRSITCNIKSTLNEKIKYPSIFEGSFSHLLGFFLELFDGPFVNAATFVDQVTSGSGLARVHMPNHHNVDMSLFFTHDVKSSA